MTEDLARRVQDPASTRALAAFIANVRFDDLPDEVVEAARIFIMDTVAVSVAGTTYDATDKALLAAVGWGAGDTRVAGRPDCRLSRTSAAFLNGMQLHALEWDALHEPSVVIAMCAPLGALLAELDSQTVSGKELIVAAVVAVEVAVFFGGDSATGPRFFRPSCAGGMGAVAGLARLRGFDEQQIIQALGLGHAQTSGTMQAHWEGSMALPMQIGNASRMAHTTVDMVAAGLTGPVDIVNGRFGYFKLFEAVESIPNLLAGLGQPFKMTEMAHKPFPAGRATQATLTMIRDLRALHNFSCDDIQSLRVFVPPLVRFLVGRPVEQNMTPSYARLCLCFVAPLMLLDNDVDPLKYTAAHFSDPQILALGAKIEILADDNPDENALGPQRMELELASGEVLHAHCEHPLGSPGNPLSKSQRETKVQKCLQLGQLGSGAPQLIASANRLDELDDATVLLDLVTQP